LTSVTIFVIIMVSKKKKRMAKMKLIVC